MIQRASPTVMDERQLHLGKQTAMLLIYMALKPSFQSVHILSSVSLSKPSEVGRATHEETDIQKGN